MQDERAVVEQLEERAVPLSRSRFGGRRYELQAPASLAPIWEASGTRPSSPGVVAARRRDSRLRRSLAVADVAGLYGALLFMLIVLGGNVSLRATAFLIAPLVVLSAKALGLYDRDQHVLSKGTVDEIPKLLYLCLLVVMSCWLLEHFLLFGHLTRPQVFLLVLTSFIATTGFRALARRLVIARSYPEPCVVLGTASDARRIATKLEQAGSVNAVVIGRVAPAGEPEAEEGQVPALGRFEDLAAITRDRGLERVIIAPSGTNQEQIIDNIRSVKALGIKVTVLPRLMEVLGFSSSIDDVNGTLFMGVRPYGLSQSSAALKRVLDLVVAGVAVVILSPLLAVVTLAIKLDSRGPVFFRQRRIGRSGECFEMLKFRSMVKDAEDIKPGILHLNQAEGGLFKIDADPRVTRVGRLLRRTYLDELPQLLNVLSGEMSLVGPRPLVPDEDALIDGWQRRRLAVKPGMTGLWQIFGSSRIPLPEMVKIDYLYGANWSLWLDMKILLRTIPYVLRQSGL